MSRIWDAFLTDQDRAHVAAKPPGRLGFGKRPALLLIDLYRWVFGDKPEPVLEAMKAWPSSCGLAAWNSIPYTQRLLQAARKAGIPVIYSTDMSEPALVGWAKGSRRGTDGPVDRDLEARRMRAHDIVDEVAPLPGELLLHKSAPSVFWGTPLKAQLTALGVDTLIVGGESTSGCVRAAVVDGCTNRYRMMVVEECVFDRHEATHAMNLFDMNQKYADVISLAEALDYLGCGKFTYLS